MSTITRDALAAIRPDMDAALAAVARKHGLASLKCTNCTFDPSSGNFVMKVEGVAKGGKTKEAARYEQSKQFDDGLPPLGYVFRSGEASYSVIGMNTTGTKVMAERLDAVPARTFLFQREAIKRLFSKSASDKPLLV
jgi:hypothetical protein